MISVSRQEATVEESGALRPPAHRSLSGKLRAGDWGFLHHRSGSHEEADGVEAEIGEEFAAFAVLDEAVGDPQALDPAGVEASCVGRFKDSGAEAAVESAFFDGDHKAALLQRREERTGVERTQEAGVDDPDIQTI